MLGWTCGQCELIEQEPDPMHLYSIISIVLLLAYWSPLPGIPGNQGLHNML